MHRVKSRFPGELGLKSTWCRMVTPMAGKNRGLVMLPDKGTEVIVVFAYRSLTPIVIGAVYNGKDDKAEPYRNDDKKNNKRVFWSRSGHQVIFDDTPGAEKVEVGACAKERLNVESAPVYHRLDDANKTLTSYSEGFIFHNTQNAYSIKCKSFSLKANRVIMRSGAQNNMTASNISVQSSVFRATSPDTLVRAPGLPMQFVSSPESPSPKHPPKKKSA